MHHILSQRPPVCVQGEEKIINSSTYTHDTHGLLFMYRHLYALPSEFRISIHNDRNCSILLIYKNRAIQISVYFSQVSALS